MERLTEKICSSYDIKDRLSKTKWQTHETYAVIQKLGDLEDVLEKNYIESVEELDLILQGLAKVHQENANLKNELTELKQEAIVPKFERQSQVYGFAYGRIKQYVVIAYLDNMYTLCEDTQANTIDACNNDYLVETKEEAEQKLAEIGGKDE